MRRFKQQLSEEECLEILKTAKRGVLAVLGDEGYPYAVPLDFVYEDGKIYFHCAKQGGTNWMPYCRNPNALSASCPMAYRNPTAGGSISPASSPSER